MNEINIESAFTLEIEDYRPWRELALAVVLMAVDDYRSKLRAFRKDPSPRTWTAVELEERWLLGELCDTYLQGLTTGAKLVEELRREAGFNAKNDK